MSQESKLNEGVDSSRFQNNDIEKMEKNLMMEAYHSPADSKYYSYYMMLDALATENTCSKKYPYRTIYDQYWNSFYCKKNMSMDTDLTKIRFV